MAGGLILAIGAASIALALNVGANNSAAEMGPAYGSGVQSRRRAVALIAVFCVAGALIAGHRVLSTVGARLVGGEVLATSLPGVLAVVLAPLVLIGFANLLKVPISTSHAVVGALAGLGIYTGSANFHLLGVIVVWWIATPIAALLLSYLLARTLYPQAILWVGRLRSPKRAQIALAAAVTLSSCWMAFSAGSNSLAKSIGPAVGAGVFQASTAALVGGAAMALGALLLGGRMIHMVGKEITSICPVCAIIVQGVAASLVLTASLSGIPVSLAEIVTCSVIGFSCARNGIGGTAANHHVRRMVLLWPAAPVVAAALTFLVVAIL